MADPTVKKREALLRDLLDQSVVTAAEIARAELMAERNHQPVEHVLNQMGVLSDENLVQASARAAGCAVWESSATPPQDSVVDLSVSREFLRRHRLLPLSLEAGRLTVAACDPLDDRGLAGLVFATGHAVDVLAAAPSEWRRVFAEHYAASFEAPVDMVSRSLDRELDRLADASADSTGARTVSTALEAAVERGASDIHFEPRRHDARIRLRLDGRLIPLGTVSLEIASAAVARIKVLSDLDLGEKRLPQDGRATFVIEGRPIEVRVSVVPTAFGEGAVLRILDRNSVRLDLDGLGFSEDDAQRMRKASQAHHGMFLVTGPTGSGKTTTLYALLNGLAGSERKILSIEDPIEYHFDHVVQTQVSPAIGLTFASTLRAFLRQDPDVLLVGEIRDAETAAVAVQAAMTGHLVLASVHANDALRVLPRLIDMGVEPYQLAAAFLGSAAQRLARRLCPHCRVEAEPTDAELAFLNRHGSAASGPFYRAAGCSACGGLGAKGRIALSEVLMADEAFLRTIARGADQGALADQAIDLGLSSMAADGLGKAQAGLVSIAELIVVLGDT